MNIIELSNIEKKDKEKVILNRISFNVKKGEILAILGHNGAGKTTLINSLMRLTSYEGNIKFSFRSSDIYKKIAYQMQSTSFESEAKVHEICDLYKKLLKSDIDICQLLKDFNILESKDSFIKNLSRGQKQMLAILLTLIGKPKVLIFDELTTGLDSLNRRVIWDILKKLNKEKGIAIIITSHFLEEVEYLADRVIILKKGKVEKIGYVEDIVKDQFGNMKKIQFETVHIDKAKSIFGKQIKIQGRVVSFVYKDIDECDIYNKVKDLQGENITMNRFSFEDAFLQMLGYKLAEEGGIIYESLCYYDCLSNKTTI